MVSSEQAPLDTSSVQLTDEPQAACPGSLVITARRHDEAAVLTVAGDVDLGTSDQMREEILRCLADRPPVLVVDLAGVTFFGSTGLGVLLETRDAATPHTMVRVVGNRTVLRTMQLTGVDQVLAVFDDVQDALTGT